MRNSFLRFPALRSAKASLSLIFGLLFLSCVLTACTSGGGSGAQSLSSQDPSGGGSSSSGGGGSSSGGSGGSSGGGSGGGSGGATTGTLSIADAAANEYGVATVVVSLSNAVASDVTVDYATIAGTASAGSDFRSVSGTLTIPAGKTSGTISVPIVTDFAKEATKSFQVHLSNATVATIASDTATVTLNDDDDEVLKNVSQITTGNNFSCALLSSGQVKCWGSNSNSELGLGASSTVSMTDSAIAVPGISDAIEIASGEDYTCAVLSTGVVKCWGGNAYGQTGDASAGWGAITSDPSAVAGVANAIHVAAGSYHSCAVINDGSVKCWGINTYGQLGNGQGQGIRPATSVSGLASAAVKVVVGYEHSCALLDNASVQCWGSNGTGQMGVSAQMGASLLLPLTVDGLSSGVVSIAASYHTTCAVLTNGALKCWGYNTNGQIGDNSTTMRNSPTDVDSLNSGVSSVQMTSQHVCAVLTSGGVKCWGERSTFAESAGLESVGDPLLVPVAIAPLSSGVAGVAVSPSHNCALLTSGEVRCWSGYGSGILGFGSNTNAALHPKEVVGLNSGVVQIARGYSTSCAVTDGGALRCWGQYTGDGTKINRPQPVEILSSGVSAVAIGDSTGCLLTSAGAVKCWGMNQNGQVGDGNSGYDNDGNPIFQGVPVDVSGLSSGVSQISSGSSHSCALLSNGTIKCWGTNSSGELGDGNSGLDSNSNPLISAVPVLVQGITTAVKVSAGDRFTCALLSDHTVKCWGSNSSGKLGDGTQNDHAVPALVTGITSAIDIAASQDDHACVVLSTGEVNCWGDGYDGQIGDADPSSSARLTPTPAQGVTDAVAVAVGEDHTCALRANGAVLCWGDEGRGKIGDGSTSGNDVIAPVAVTGLMSGVKGLSASSNNTCALLEAGGVVCWGDAASLGNGLSQGLPVPVLDP